MLNWRSLLGSDLVWQKVEWKGDWWVNFLSLTIYFVNKCNLFLNRRRIEFWESSTKDSFNKSGHSLNRKRFVKVVRISSDGKFSCKVYSGRKISLECFKFEPQKNSRYWVATNLRQTYSKSSYISWNKWDQFSSWVTVEGQIRHWCRWRWLTT